MGSVRLKTVFCLASLCCALPSACGGDGESVDPAIGHVGLATCDLYERCGCTFVDCGGFQELVESAYEQAIANGLVFDPQCAEAIAQQIRQSSCDLDLDALVSIQSCGDFCSLFHGSKFAGEPCQQFGSGSDCGRGLVCYGEVCTDPCTVQPPTEGQPCALSEEPCVEGLYCLRNPEVQDDSGVCVALPGPGQPCTQQSQCTDDARCDFQNPDTPMCVALAEDGAPCTGHLECLSGHCPDGRCRPRLSEGEECTGNLRCAEGLSCIDGFCQGSQISICGELTGQDR